MTELNSANENFPGKKKKALTKFNSFREKSTKREKEAREVLEEAGGIWKEVSEKFKWWQSMP